MLLEGVEEFIKYVFFCLFAHFYIRMTLGIVASLEIFNVDATVTVRIKLLEGKSNYIPSSFTHLPYNCPQELVVVDFSVAISVKDLENPGNFLRVLAYAIVSHSLSEFLSVQGL